LANIDDRGKLNVQEFHVAMGLIYRSTYLLSSWISAHLTVNASGLNGMPIPSYPQSLREIKVMKLSFQCKAARSQASQDERVFFKKKDF
jgi:hypothetical protein